MPRDKNIFTLNPTSLDMRRSVFNRNSQHKTSFNLGELIPIYLDEILPGDTISLDLATVTRMSTPIAPIMDNLYMDVYAFFVPNRIVWNHWQQFCGENDTGAWTQTTNYTIPVQNIGNTAAGFGRGRLGDYFGLPVVDSSVRTGFTGLPNNLNVSELPLRGYYKIANDWFFDENSIGPKVFSIGDSTNTSIHYYDRPVRVSRFHDLFSSCLPAPQKGASVTVPMLGSAPVVGEQNVHAMGSYGVKFASTSGAGFYGPVIGDGNGGALGFKRDDNIGADYDFDKTNLVADLSNATAATINQIRYAFQVQKLLEKDARGGHARVLSSLLFKKIAEKIWKVLVRIIRGEGFCQPQRIDGEIIHPRGRDTFVKRYAELCSNV